jgi:glycosyltransferase involved in cell wall biosynthesis
VVPVCNEAESLDALVGEIRDVAGRNDLDVEVVFVDDGSRDESWERIVSLEREDRRIGGIRFRRNYGKAAALMAGFATARRDVVFMMDADLQDPPEEMPRLLARLDEGYDLVSGWKQVRHDPWHKVYPSRVFNKLIGWLTGVALHDHVCGFKVMRREVAKELRIYGELHRFIAVLSAARGFRVAEIPTLHRARTRGVGKYGFTRFFKGFLDLLTVLTITRYRWRPQHVIGVAGLLMILAALLVPRLTFVFAGLMVIAIGLVAEIIVADRPLDGLYEVVERAGWCADENVVQG